MNLIFSEEAGELYDVLSSLTLYFNGESQSSLRADPQATEEVRESINLITKYFRDVDDNIGLFFDARKDGRTFALDELYPIMLENTVGFPAWREWQEMMDPKTIYRLLFQFWVRKQLPESVGDAADLVDVASLSERTKCQLLSLCTNPEWSVKRLCGELDRMMPRVRYCRMGLDRFADARREEIEAMGARAFAKMICNVPGHMARWPQDSELQVAFCAMNRYAFRVDGTHPRVILGIDYPMVVESLHQNPRQYELPEVLKALGDPLRGRLVKRLREALEPPTLNELSLLVGENTSTVKYQLSVLEKCGMVRTEKIRKMPRYRLQADCAEFALRNLSRLLGKGPELTIEEKLHGAAEKWWNN